MRMSELKLFEKFRDSIDFTVSDFLGPDLSNQQKKAIDDVFAIIKRNASGDIESFGASIKNNESLYKEIEGRIKENIEKEEFKPIKKALKDFAKKISEFIDATCFAIIPVKELPWKELFFRSVPEIHFTGDKMNINKEKFAFYGEIKRILPRITIFGKLKGSDPLFAPHALELDLKIPSEVQNETQKVRNYMYVYHIIQTLNSEVTKNQLVKYEEEFQRHGDPVCDYLMNDDQLKESMKKMYLTSDIISEVSVNAIAIPLKEDGSSLVVALFEHDIPQKFDNCFEFLLNFSAGCVRAPSDAQVAVRSGGAQGSPELKTWTTEELAEQTQQRGGGVPPGMEIWTKEDLIQMQKEQSSGIPEGMEVWTEEELAELSKKRQGGGLNIPEWEPDKNMTECSKCGYNLRPSWRECPVCGRKVDEEQSDDTPESENDN